MGKTAILLGASGLTGGHLLEILLKDDYYQKIITFGRRPLGNNHSKIEEHVVDMFKLNSYTDKFKADVVFCCIGTTASKTPDKTRYRTIDYGIPVTAAQISSTNKIPCFIVMSSLGAHPKSRVFYSRTKGEMEKDVLLQDIPITYILRPSLIVGNRDEKRLGESFFNRFMNLINPLLFGKFAVYKPISSHTIAQTMAVLPKTERESGIIPSDTIKSIAQHGH